MSSSVVDFKCRVERLIYSKDGYTVALCSSADNVPEDAVRENPVSGEHTFIAVGYGLPSTPHQKIRVCGEWQNNKKYGSLQLKVSDCTDDVAVDKNSIVDYLSSGIITGVGRATAEKIYKFFGERSIQVLESNPRQLLNVPGIKGKKLEEIINSFAKHQDMHLLTQLLAPYDVSYRMIVRVRKTLGDGAAIKVRENPYILCEVGGIGFLTADAIALKMGVPENSRERIKGGICYVIRERMTAGGHVYVDRQDILDACVGKSGILRPKSSDVALTADDVDAVIGLMMISGDLNGGQSENHDHVYLPAFFKSEAFAAEKIAEHLRTRSDLRQPDDWASLITQAEEKVGVQLAEMQRKAVEMALRAQCSIITGGPGSGKTTILRVITEAIQSGFNGIDILLAAPTARAARRMSDQAGMDACTLHHLLNLKPGGYSNLEIENDEFIHADMIVVDEASMIDAMLFADLLYQMRPGTKLLLLGDADQLPSVGPGNVLRELLSVPELIPHVKLDKVFRQGTDSIIPTNAAKIRTGKTDLHFKREQFAMIRCENEEEGQHKIIQLMERLAEIGELDRTQILCPLRRRGAVSVNQLNNVLHDIVNPPSQYKREITIAGTLFREGDKVMQSKNRTQVSNGDIGKIRRIFEEGERRIDEDTGEKIVLSVEYDMRGEPVEYSMEDALDLEPAIATTIHKSQGSEVPRVIVPLFKSMSFFLVRNLLYTAVTRAKEQVVLVTDGDAALLAIRKEDTSKRNTELAERIRRACLNAKEKEGDY